MSVESVEGLSWCKTKCRFAGAARIHPAPMARRAWVSTESHTPISCVSWRGKNRVSLTLRSRTSWHHLLADCESLSHFLADCRALWDFERELWRAGADKFGCHWAETAINRFVKGKSTCVSSAPASRSNSSLHQGILGQSAKYLGDSGCIWVNLELCYKSSVKLFSFVSRGDVPCPQVPATGQFNPRQAACDLRVRPRTHAAGAPVTRCEVCEVCEASWYCTILYRLSWESTNRFPPGRTSHLQE